MKRNLILFMLLSILPTSAVTQHFAFYGKVLLQGPYAGNGIMNTRLNHLADFPHNQPYAISPWNYSGSEYLPAVPDSVVDWILVELRSSPDTIVDRRAALLLRNGSIVDTNLAAGLVFRRVPAGNYYVAVFHRNHLAVMTATTVALPNISLLDFSDTLVTAPFGGGSRALISLGSGRYGMIAGDVNVNNQLKYSGQGNDRSLILQRILSVTGSNSITSVISGYYQEDITMDSILKYSGPGNDPSRIIQNIVALTGSNAITGTYQGTVPPGIVRIPYTGCGDVLTDKRDGQQYPTVQIGTQCWMAKNLNVGTMVNSIQTPGIHSDVSNNGIIEKYCFGNDPNYCNTYGGLYDWEEMMGYVTTEGVQGICPPGWHIPTDAEWTTLEDFLGGSSIAGGKLKESGYTHWNSPNTGATNSTGFTALPGGSRGSYGNFGDAGNYGLFWSSTPAYSTKAWWRAVQYDNQNVNRWNERRLNGFSVRCLGPLCNPPQEKASAGPDIIGLHSDSLMLQGNQPSDGIGSWTIISGMGAIISSSGNPNSVFYGLPGHAYTLVWTITTICGLSSDTVNISFSASPFSCGDTLTDVRDGKRYPTVQIGTQCWLAKNLNAGSMVNGTVNQTDNGILEKYCYNNSAVNCDIYGGLYMWHEAMQYSSSEATRGICPPTGGWHLPTDNDWCTLLTFLDNTVNCSVMTNYTGTDAGGKLKETGTVHWTTPNSVATNSSDFTGLPGGLRSTSGAFSDWHDYGHFWTSTQYDGINGIRQQLSFDDPRSRRSYNSKEYGMTVRCIKEPSNQPPAVPSDPNPPNNSTSQQINILLSWSCTDPETDPLTYDVYFGVTNPPPQVSTGQSANTYNPGTLAYSTIYSWKIVAHDDHSNTIEGPVWSFGTMDQQIWQCGDSLLDTRDGQKYLTVQIGPQCWMAKNLNIGIMVNSNYTGSNHSDVTNNGIIEKYCYDNDSNYCNAYGGLYDWDEMMGYVTVEGVQGICPPTGGWHIPTDAEWKILEGTVDSLYGVGDPVWDNIEARGYDAGGRLKEAGFDHWYSPNTGASNSSGFTALPGGYRNLAGSFENINNHGYFWSSSVYSTLKAWRRFLTTYEQYVDRDSRYRTSGFSVRCVWDLSSCTPQPDQANAGPDSFNITVDSIILQANIPTNGNGVWLVTSGTGGSLADSTNPQSVFHGVPGNAYTLIWTISTICGSTADTVSISFTSFSSFSCGDTLTDIRDGQKYPTVQIWGQCWMASNLNIGTFTLSIHHSNYNSNLTDNGIIEKYCYSNDTSYCSIYGGLYDWNEMMDYSSIQGGRGICMEGWHLPSDHEWKVLEGAIDSQYGMYDPEWDDLDYRGSDAGGKLKKTGTTFWNSPNTGASNNSGFSATGGGCRDQWGDFTEIKQYAYFYAGASRSADKAWARRLEYNRADITRIYNYKVRGLSVRCIWDSIPPCSPQPDQANAGPDMLNIPNDTVILQAISPANGTGSWRIPENIYGSLSNTADPSAVFRGYPGLRYSLVWLVTTPCGVSMDTVNISFATSDTFTCGDFIQDERNSEQYPTVLIGNQCWLGKNMNIGKYVESRADLYAHSDVSNNGIIEKYCHGDSTSCIIYGGLYDWNEMMEYAPVTGSRGICPPIEGWHIPTDEEWKILEGVVDGQYGVGHNEWNKVNARGSDVGAKLKETGNVHWNDNPVGTNSSGFTALGGGYRTSVGWLVNLGSSAHFWSSTSATDTTAWNRGIYSVFSDPYKIYRNALPDKAQALSVRCLLNIMPCNPPPDQANAGPDQYDVSADNVMLIANIPANGTGYWTIISGNQGRIDNPDNNITAFFGMPGSMYGLTWTIINPCGYSIDTVMISFDSTHFKCGDTLLDPRDGQGYPTVQIGKQCWMAANLNAGTMINGTNNQTDNGTIEKYCHGDQSGNCTIYGGLYQWDELMEYNTVPGTRGICPAGWHVPDDDEFCELCTFLDTTVDCNTIGWQGTDCGGKLKATGTMLWSLPNTGATNSSGFTAIGSGYRNPGSGAFNIPGQAMVMWTSSQSGSSNAWERDIVYHNDDIGRYNNSKQYGYSVRCVKDFTCGDTLTDFRDQQNYPTKQIGHQCWMAKNLNIGTFIISDNTGMNNSNASNNGVIEKYCYNNDTSNCDVYGGLYDWNEIMYYNTNQGSEGICPFEWYIPTEEDWVILVDFLGGKSVAGKKLKEADTTHWISPNNASNSSGFTALPAGLRHHNNGSFIEIGKITMFWSSSKENSYARIRQLYYSYDNIIEGVTYTSYGASVRCLQRCSPAPDQADAGPDSVNIPGNNIVLQANTPGNGIGQWTIVGGTGGNLSDILNPLSSFTGNYGSSYMLVWTIYNACGSSSDTVNISFASFSSFSCGDTLTDIRDGQKYPTVQIGTQCWMGQNLNVGSFVNSVYSGSAHSDVHNDGIIEKYCYNNDSTYCDIYGGLYDWDEVMNYDTTEGSQGICPSGWHVPAFHEWSMVGDVLGSGIAGGKLKEAGTAHWNSPNTGASNSSGFTAIGSGQRGNWGDFVFLMEICNFWTSTLYSHTRAMNFYVHYSYNGLYNGYNIHSDGYPLRCVNDTIFGNP